MKKRNELRELEKLVGKQVDAFNDGKWSPSRLVRVVIDAVGTRDDLTQRERRLWRGALRRDCKEAFYGVCHYLLPDGTETRQFWDWNCNLFLSGHILYDDRTIRDRMLFAKRPDGYGWYCVNWNYSLDLKGVARRKMLPQWRKCADEQGLRMAWDPDAGSYNYFDKKTGRRVEA